MYVCNNLVPHSCMANGLKQHLISFMVHVPSYMFNLLMAATVATCDCCNAGTSVLLVCVQLKCTFPAI